MDKITNRILPIKHLRKHRLVHYKCFFTTFLIFLTYISVTIDSVPNRRGMTRFQNPSKIPFQCIWLKGENTVQLTSMKFETLVPENKNAILTESLVKNRIKLHVCIYTYMLTDRVDSKIKEQEGQIAEGLLYFKMELIDS